MQEIKKKNKIRKAHMEQLVISTFPVDVKIYKEITEHEKICKLN